MFVVCVKGKREERKRERRWNCPFLEDNNAEGRRERKEKNKNNWRECLATSGCTKVRRRGTENKQRREGKKRGRMATIGREREIDGKEREGLCFGRRSGLGLVV